MTFNILSYIQTNAFLVVGQLGGKFVSTLLNTASKNIETTLIQLELAGEYSDEGFRSAMKGVASAAQRGAGAIGPKQSPAKETPTTITTITVKR